MRTRPFRVAADVLSNGVWHALMVLALAVAVASGVSAGAHGAQAATPVPANLQPVPSSIRNAPFLAEVSTEYDHQLANGNHIRRETRGRVARDSQGRVRTETEVTSPFFGIESPENIAIQDPVQRVLIHIDRRARVARVFHLSEAPVVSILTSNGSVPAKPGRGLAAATQIADAASGNSYAAHGDSNPNVELLGMKLIEGVRAAGTRTTRTTTNAQGEIVVAITEVWFSPELQMVLLSISDDGESGHSVMRLTHIQRTAPNEELFRVPAEYTVRDSNPIATASRH